MGKGICLAVQLGTALRSFQLFFPFLAPPSISFPEVTGEANSWTFRIFCNMKASVFPTVSKESGSLGLLSQYHSFICFPASRNLLFLPLPVCPCAFLKISLYCHFRKQKYMCLLNLLHIFSLSQIRILKIGRIFSWL